MEIYHGNIVYSKDIKNLVEYKDSYIVVQNGIVEGIYETLPERYSNVEIKDFGKDVIIPAFTDLHTHAPQYPNRGLAMDEMLTNWLDKYTFPLEEKFKDETFASDVYNAFVDDMIAHGTMHAVVFGTIHNKATDTLIDQLERRGIMSYVGKVNMDKNSPKYLLEDTQESIDKTELFLQKHIDKVYSKPILTPRFAPTCSFELLKELGNLMAKYKVGLQTHIVESKWEKEEAKKCFDGCRCDMQIYEDAGLLEYGPTIAAHFIYPSQEDIDILKKHNGIAVQCADATTNVIAGIMPTGLLLDNGINIGIGSDISAGQSLGIYTQIASAIRLSKIKSLYEKENRVISFAEAFYLGTKQGGSIFGNVGSFEKGYYFDALVIGGLEDKYQELKPVEVVERFCYAGEVKNIKYKFLRGKEI